MRSQQCVASTVLSCPDTASRGKYLAKILAKACWTFLDFLCENESGNQINANIC